jgi:hypothetical protein
MTVLTSLDEDSLRTVIVGRLMDINIESHEEYASESGCNEDEEKKEQNPKNEKTAKGKTTFDGFKTQPVSSLALYLWSDLATDDCMYVYTTHV